MRQQILSKYTGKQLAWFWIVRIQVASVGCFLVIESISPARCSLGLWAPIICFISPIQRSRDCFQTWHPTDLEGFKADSRIMSRMRLGALLFFILAISSLWTRGAAQVDAPPVPTFQSTSPSPHSATNISASPTLSPEIFSVDEAPEPCLPTLQPPPSPYIQAAAVVLYCAPSTPVPPDYLICWSLVRPLTLDSSTVLSTDCVSNLEHAIVHGRGRTPIYLQSSLNGTRSSVVEAHVDLYTPAPDLQVSPVRDALYVTTLRVRLRPDKASS